MPVRNVTSKARQRLIAMDKGLQQDLVKSCERSGVRLKAAHEEVVSDWDGKPKFVFVTRIKPTRIRVSIRVLGRNAQKWHWVNEGTKGPYPIPKFPTGKLLRFQTGYQPHTKAIAKHHQGSGEATGGWVSAGQVMHPGIEAREFTKTIDKEETPLARRDIENTTRRKARGK